MRRPRHVPLGRVRGADVVQGGEEGVQLWLLDAGEGEEEGEEGESDGRSLGTEEEDDVGVGELGV